VDFLRAFSLIVVVIYHWVFTIVIWAPHGPVASSPLEYTRGLWILTWILQVVPLFFFVGGFVHRAAYTKARRQRTGYWAFVAGRLRRLLVPALAMLAAWTIVGLAASRFVSNNAAVGKTVKLVVSPLWFIGVYVALVLLVPALIWLHERAGVAVVALLAALVLVVDALRFGGGLAWVASLNLLFGWALCHQLGFFYDRLIALPRSRHWTLAGGGILLLAALVLTNRYPGSMVGVPGQRFSNMAPPTFCIVALCFLQIGLVMVIRPWVVPRLRRPRWAVANDAINRYAMPVFLFHTTAYVAAMGLLMGVGIEAPQRPTTAWWLQRPLFLALPLACAALLIALFGRRWVTSPEVHSRNA
jgi:hypothetical protein